MRTLVTIILIAGLALPAAAAEDCVTVHIGHEPQLRVEQVDNPRWDVSYALVPPYVWFQWGRTAETLDETGAEDTISFDVSDESVESITACPDGSVTIDTSAPVEESVDEPDTTPVAAPQPEAEAVGSAPHYETAAEFLQRVCAVLHRGFMTRVCSLPDLGLTVS